MNEESPATQRGVRMLDAAEVLKRRNVSRAKLYRDMAEGDFPLPIQDGAKSLWLEHEVEAWFAQKAQGPRGVRTRGVTK